jgi:hypothetical protein
VTSRAPRMHQCAGYRQVSACPHCALVICARQTRTHRGDGLQPPTWYAPPGAHARQECAAEVVFGHGVAQVSALGESDEPPADIAAHHIQATVRQASLHMRPCYDHDLDALWVLGHSPRWQRLVVIHQSHPRLAAEKNVRERRVAARWIVAEARAQGEERALSMRW